MKNNFALIDMSMHIPYMLVDVVENVFSIMEVLLRGRTASCSDLDLGLIIAIIMQRLHSALICAPRKE